MLTNIVLFCAALASIVSQGVSRAECVIRHMLLLLLQPPGQLSWENTAPGSGSLRIHLSLWTPEGHRGPSGFRQIIHKQLSRPHIWNAGLISKGQLKYEKAVGLTRDSFKNQQINVPLSLYKNVDLLVDI